MCCRGSARTRGSSRERAASTDRRRRGVVHQPRRLLAALERRTLSGSSADAVREIEAACARSRTAPAFDARLTLAAAGRATSRKRAVAWRGLASALAASLCARGDGAGPTPRCSTTRGSRRCFVPGHSPRAAADEFVTSARSARVGVLEEIGGGVVHRGSGGRRAFQYTAPASCVSRVAVRSASHFRRSRRLALALAAHPAPHFQLTTAHRRPRACIADRAAVVYRRDRVLVFAYSASQDRRR